MRYHGVRQAGSGLRLEDIDFEKDPEHMDDIRRLLNDDPDLTAFKNRAAALMYFGWADTASDPVHGDRLLREGAGKNG